MDNDIFLMNGKVMDNDILIFHSAIQIDKGIIKMKNLIMHTNIIPVRHSTDIIFCFYH